ncbi:hypothetical protein PU629_06425 [Pullulanibacillus sp. KACC 23026]|uniref:hypothetical protein n=1 Tax=Pullulanibacillus sp. KACC 23026 TaxID=3028315 RepID=UPI0023B1D122|nr:hypothetical protein [Pullulanibacillus sp. KACC 23026]WEG14000.1 hypothetical protein PU629_06425 [Pullulanibacillus sp. KACC 23026]
MKFKILRGFVSSILTGVKDAVHDMEISAETAKYWTDCGLIEEVKDVPAPSVASPTATVPPSDTTADKTTETTAQQPSQPPTPEVTPDATAEAVTPDENK